MNIREQSEELERKYLSPYASLSCESQGREREEEQCDIRTVYQRDRDRIIHCKAFRRMKHKTQVFLAPMGDHYRTRLTHTLEVAQIARTIAKALRMRMVLSIFAALLSFSLSILQAASAVKCFLKTAKTLRPAVSTAGRKEEI